MYIYIYLSYPASVVAADTRTKIEAASSNFSGAEILSQRGAHLPICFWRGTPLPAQRSREAASKTPCTATAIPKNTSGGGMNHKCPGLGHRSIPPPPADS